MLFCDVAVCPPPAIKKTVHKATFTVDSDDVSVDSYCELVEGFKEKYKNSTGKINFKMGNLTMDLCDGGR